jgi:hypothetical protein
MHDPRQAGSGASTAIPYLPSQRHVCDGQPTAGITSSVCAARNTASGAGWLQLQRSPRTTMRYPGHTTPSAALFKVLDWKMLYYYFVVQGKRALAVSLKKTNICNDQ